MKLDQQERTEETEKEFSVLSFPPVHSGFGGVLHRGERPCNELADAAQRDQIIVGLDRHAAILRILLQEREASAERHRALFRPCPPAGLRSPKGSRSFDSCAPDAAIQPDREAADAVEQIDKPRAVPACAETEIAAFAFAG